MGRRVIKQFVIQYYVDDSETTDADDDDENDNHPLPAAPPPLPNTTNIMSGYFSYIDCTVCREKSLQVNLPLPLARDHDGVNLKRLAVSIKETTPPPESSSANVPRRGRRRHRKTVEMARGSPSESVKVAEEKEAMLKTKTIISKKRIKHYYSSTHRILLVGEGDFSFSACLAVAFGSASNMIATSLDSQGLTRSTAVDFAVFIVGRPHRRRGVVVHLCC
ncbi:hypothetical protein ACP275_13G112100 [Erythranthe tilingii]